MSIIDKRSPIVHCGRCWRASRTCDLLLLGSIVREENYRAGLRVIETERIRGNCTQRSDAHSSCQVRFKNGFQERQSRFTGEVRRLDLYVQALDPQLQGLPLLRQEI